MNKMKLFSAIFAVMCMVACSSNQSKNSEQKTADSSTATAGGEWTRIEPVELGNAIQLISKGKMALAAGDKNEMNAMVVTQGSIGYLWHRPVVTVYVSSGRYTHGLLEKNDYFTLSSFAPEEMSKLMYLGTHSGRDENKIENSGVHTEFTELGNPTFEEATLTIECKKIYAEPFIKEKLDSTALQMYSDGTEVHTMFIGEIVNVWSRK